MSDLVQLGPVENEEILGRAWFQSVKSPSRIKRDFRTAYRRHGEVSVDRIDVADLVYLRNLHDDEANARESVDSFHGWQCFTAERARDASAEVKATPKIPINPWHADVIPLDGEDSLTELCTAVAARAKWRGRDEVPSGLPSYSP